jgi:hypothetical protein
MERVIIYNSDTECGCGERECSLCYEVRFMFPPPKHECYYTMAGFACPWELTNAK